MAGFGDVPGMLENLTSYGAVQFPSVTQLGAVVEVTCVAVRYALPKPLRARATVALSLAEEQRLPVLEDVHWADPASSSLRYEAQNAWSRRGTDVYLNGTAHAPQHKPVDTLLVTLAIGAVVYSVMVIGDRVWRGSSSDPSISSAKRFTSMPLVYERSFGGSVRSPDGRLVAQEARNPVGVGHYATSNDACDAPLPNLEKLDRRIVRWRDKPPPAGFGPIARSWQPRVAFAGTFDDEWVKTRSPLWPADFDLRHLNAAASGLALSEPLRDDELFVLTGLSPLGSYAFRLRVPRLRLRVVRAKRSDEQHPLTCDAVLIEPDESAVTLYSRVAVPASMQPSARDLDVLRELEPWEDS